MKIFLYLFIISIIISCERNESGLPLSFDEKILDGFFIKSIAFDQHGNAWIGTFKQGLIYHSNQETIYYNQENSPFSDSTVINDIAIDGRNNVWIACESLVKFDGQDFHIYNKSNTPIPEDYIRSVEIDSEDNVWFSSSRSREGGLVKYDGLNWKVYSPINTLLPANSISSIAIDGRDRVWIAMNRYVDSAYLAVLENEDISVFTSSDIGFTPYWMGNIEAGTDGKVYGSVDYSLSSMWGHEGPQVFVFDGLISEQYNYDKFSNVKFISLDRNNRVWCGVYGGYAVLDGSDWIKEDSCFREEGLFAIEQAPSGAMWFGTGDGVYVSK